MVNLKAVFSTTVVTTNNLFPIADQIALPDFNAGAMENWGLITYRETALLYDEAFSSNSNKERIATIIAHELAHMVRFYHCDLYQFTNVDYRVMTVVTPDVYCDSLFNQFKY